MNSGKKQILHTETVLLIKRVKREIITMICMNSLRTKSRTVSADQQFRRIRTIFCFTGKGRRSEMAKKVISAGHVCLDVTPVFPQGHPYGNIADILVPGKLVQMEPASVSSGGSVSNTGLALKLLGNDVTLMGKVGDDDLGAMLARIFARYDAGGLIIDKESATSYSVVLAIPGLDWMFLHCPGANNSFSNADIPDGPLEDAVLFHFGYPTLMRKMYENDGKELADLFRRVKSKGIATSLDLTAVDPNSEAGRLDWTVILKNVLPYVDFFAPSFEEICFMLDRTLYDRLSAERADMTAFMDFEHEVKPLADKLIALGCKTVLIKCGISGMYYRTASREVMAGTGERIGLDIEAWSEKEGIQPCFRADIVRSGTGAGDTSIAAFLTAVLEGEQIEDCAAIAAAEGACCVTAFDALSGLKPIEEIKARIASGWETV